MSNWFKRFFGIDEESILDVNSFEDKQAVTYDPPLMNEELGVSKTAHYNTLFSVTFDGEKTKGDIGPVKEYVPNHEILRLRGWQLYLESEVCQLIIRRFTRWVIGKGLKVQARPNKVVLGMEGIKVDDTFIENIEARFSIYAQSKYADLAEHKTLHKLAEEAYINAIASGDVLVILRVKDGIVKVQLIDGANVRTPFGFSGSLLGVDYKSEFGNKIKDGVEVDINNKHLAYWVRTGNKYERVEARDKMGRVLAYMPSGLGYRLGGTRAMPLLTAVMETSAKMERYKEATLGSAEEAAKMVYTIEHGATSTGQNPMEQFKRSAGIKKDDNSEDLLKEAVMNQQIVTTTGKQAVNMPNDAKLVPVESKKELYFNDFYTINIQIVCAVVGIPPEIALMKYDSNFSASRAALKDWEHSLGVEREQFADEFYKPIYALFLDTEVLKFKVQAPGYLKALNDKDIFVIEAYRSVYFQGANVPHIDPLKEVKAERAKLGVGSEHIPLSTIEKATEALNGGDYWENMQNYAKELKEADDEGIEKQVVNTGGVEVPNYD